MEKNNKKCIICGTMYSYCPSCNRDADKPTWYAIFHGESCKDIYDICTSYRDNVIDKKTAYERIIKCDISNLKNFNETTKAQIEEILDYAENTKAEETEVELVKFQPKFNTEKANTFKKK